MITFTATLTTSAMVIAALLMGKLHAHSTCAYRRWQAEVVRVGESLKDEPRWHLPTLCSGPQVHWSFKGKLHAQ